MDQTLTAWDSDGKPKELRATDDGQLRVVLEPRLGAALAHGKVDIVGAASAVPVSADATAYKGGILLQVHGAPASPVYIGGPGINGSTGGVQLVGGAGYVPPTGDLSGVYVWCAVNATVGWNAS